MAEYILTVFVIFVVIYALVKGCNINININYKQEFSQEDRALLEDLFNKDGEPKDKVEEVSFDEVLRNVNAIMLGDEESING